MKMGVGASPCSVCNVAARAFEFVDEAIIERRHLAVLFRGQALQPRLARVHDEGAAAGVSHRRDEPLEVTCFLGGPPAMILSAVAPLPEGVGELLLASLLAGEKIAMTSNPLGADRHRLVAESEFAICGHVPPRERRPEGPFGDHYGYYSLKHDYPVFHSDAVFHRKDAIYPATVVGKPRQEDFFIGDYLQELLSPLFPMVMPAVRDLWSYGETGFHSLAAAVVRERYGREALSAGFRILGEGQLTLTKFLLLTDTPQDLRDFRSLFEHVLARVDWQRDLHIFSQTAFDTLDYASGKVNFGSKAVMMGVGEAKVAAQGPTGFVVEHSAEIKADAKTAYDAFVKVGSWWGSNHSFSGDAKNLRIDTKSGGCWCEKLPNGGFVKHMEVVHAAPGSMLVFSGGLGPLQFMGVAGSMTVSFQNANGVTTVNAVMRTLSAKARLARNSGARTMPTRKAGSTASLCAALARAPRLLAWLDRMAARPSAAATDPACALSPDHLRLRDLAKADAAAATNNGFRFRRIDHLFRHIKGNRQAVGRRWRGRGLGNRQAGHGEQGYSNTDDQT